MRSFIEEFYYGNIEAQELSSELGDTLKKKLNTLTKSEEELTESYPPKRRNCSINTQTRATSFSV